MADENTYDVGDQPRITGTFRDLAAALADPTTVVGKVKDPSGNITTPTVTKDSTGIYRMDIPLDEQGRWYYRMEGIGTLIAASEGSFTARPTQFP